MARSVERLSKGAFRLLRNIPEGRAILINMHECLQDYRDAAAKDAELERQRYFFQILSNKLDAKASKLTSDVIDAAHHAVWDHAKKLQRQGAQVDGRNTQFVVFRTLDQVKHMVESQAHKHKRIRQLEHLCNPTSDYRTFLDGHGQVLADALNQLPSDVPLCLSKFDRDLDDHYSVWYTRYGDCTPLFQRFGIGTDGSLQANMFRDWLGLGDTFDLMPMFIFKGVPNLAECRRSSDCSHPADCTHRADCRKVRENLNRPSAFDAINHKWFKYRRHGSYRDDWGRALHIGKFLRGAKGNLDGGPEAVGPTSTVPGRFTCEYIGKLDGDFVHAWNEDLVEALALPLQPDEAFDALYGVLWPAGQVKAA